MPVIDEGFDESPVQKPGKDAGAKGRQNPLIPVMSLRSWKPDQDDIDALLGRKKTQGGENGTGTTGGNH